MLVGRVAGFLLVVAIRTMETWTTRRPLAERFWSLAETGGHGGIVVRSGVVGVVRHALDILTALDSGRTGGAGARSAEAFLDELERRESTGDLAYTAPERLSGYDSGERALVFSIGILLFEGLTGRHPLGKTARRSAEDLAGLVARTPEVTPALRGVLTRAMSADPDARFSSIAALRAELEWFVVAEEEGALALPAPAIPRVTPLAQSSVSPRSPEVELETALVPRFSFDELQPPRRRNVRGEQAGLEVVAMEDLAPRLSEPRSRRAEVLRLAYLALFLVFVSATMTALALWLLRVFA